MDETGKAGTNRAMAEEIESLKERLGVLEHNLAERYKGPKVPTSPVGDYRVVVKDSGDPGYVNKLLVGTATTGLVRIEWVMGRYGQIVPPNWSMVQMNQYLNAYVPLRYQVDDAQNLIVREAIRGEFEWLLLVEHDVILPPDAFRQLGDYMRKRDTPVVSGLYYSRSRPSEPLMYRGRGTGFYGDWEFGDKVWVDGVPTGCLLIHCGILREMWKDSEIYYIQHPDGRRDEARKVFSTPRRSWYDPETQQFNTNTGTSDLDWCTRVMKGGYLEKAGWEEHQEMEFPFLVDTNIFCKHIDKDGTQYP